MNVSAVGRTLTIQIAGAPSAQPGTVRTLQLHVASRNGRTTVRIYEHLAGVAGAWFGGILSVFGGGAGALVAGVTATATHSPAIVVGTLAAWVATVYVAARKLYGRSARKRDAELCDIFRKVVARAQDVIEHKCDPRRLR